METTVPDFRPFTGTLYDREKIPNFGSVCAPPYDVINDDQRQELAERDPHNSVNLILAQPDGDKSRYEVAAERLSSWLGAGILVDDPSPAFYLYRMGFHDELGRAHQTTGVIGALAIDDSTGILPHEETMSKPLGDQLSLLDATKTNLSPIYLLSKAAGLSALLEPSGPPIVRCTDSEGAHHRLWRLDSPALLDAISSLVASDQLVIADGHHRYETACKFNEQSPVAESGWIMGMVVELSDKELWVRPTHRIFLDADPDAVGEAFAAVFGPLEPIEADAEGLERAVLDGRTVLLGQGSPAPALVSEAWSEGDLQGEALVASLPVARLHREAIPKMAAPGRIEFEPDEPEVLAAVESGRATAAVLVPPVSVEAIRRVAEAGLKMPQKTTYFAPKPRTGAVFRRLEADRSPARK